jgi:hypothetical protein
MRPLPLSLLLFLILAPAAHGATVTRTSEVLDADGGDEVLVHSVTFEAAAGEVNNVTMAVQAGVLTARDAGAPLTAGKGCVQVDAATATCAVGAQARCSPCAAINVDGLVRLGDGADRAVLTAADGFGPTVEAGDGADVVTSPGILEGGPGDDQLTGTDEAEGMSGGAGADVLRGLGGDDSLSGDTEPQDGSPGLPEGDDVLDGGAGRDNVVYVARRIPVTIDLEAGTAGSAGEHDTLIAIEDAFGGSAADALTGTDGANKLSGGGGRDTILALGGADETDGGRHVNSGPGNDFLVFPRGDFTCGAGTDAVAAPPRRRTLPFSCERVAFDPSLTAQARPSRASDALLIGFRSTCFCKVRGRITVVRGGKVLARGTVRLRRARSGPRRATARLPLTAAGQRVLQPSRTATITFREPRFTTTRWRAPIPGIPLPEPSPLPGPGVPIEG